MKRVEIGIFGRMNAGKSTLMNLLTQQETSIVDPTPGTTADHKITLFELHGIGPCKIFDTPGIDEISNLGEKKKKKVIQTLKECDLVILTIPSYTDNLDAEKELISLAKQYKKATVIINNLFSNKVIEKDLQELNTENVIQYNLTDKSTREKLLTFIQKHIPQKKEQPLLPFVRPHHSYLLIIPMDEETPEKRLLRPQSMAIEQITRNWAYATTYRLDLAKARKGNIEEMRRFQYFVRQIPFLDVVITDSQAMDIVSKWLDPNIRLTTFSIMMIQHATQKLSLFHDGVKKIKEIPEDGKILICEACNHSRIQEDIGTVQIPKIFKRLKPSILIEHSFGREFEDKDLAQYHLIIHCGGCMISAQKLNARINELEDYEIPITNYGIFLSWVQGEEVLERVLQPWKE